MASKIDFSIRRGVSTPITFIPQTEHGDMHILKHIDYAELNIRPSYGAPLKIPLNVTQEGLQTFLHPSDTEGLMWTFATYEVKVKVRGIVQVIFEGNLTLDRDVGF